MYKYRDFWFLFILSLGEEISFEGKIKNTFSLYLNTKGSSIEFSIKLRVWINWYSYPFYSLPKCYWCTQIRENIMFIIFLFFSNIFLLLPIKFTPFQLCNINLFVSSLWLSISNFGIFGRPTAKDRKIKKRSKEHPILLSQNSKNYPFVYFLQHSLLHFLNLNFLHK